MQGTLWNTSRYPYLDISDLRNWGKQLIEQPPLTEWICTCNLTPKLVIYWKYYGKEEKLLLRSNFSVFQQYFVCLLVDLCVKTGTRFSFRDKRIFEISEVEITRVGCIFLYPLPPKYEGQLGLGGAYRIASGSFVRPSIRSSVRSVHFLMHIK